jgi:hypothetical protein
MRARWKWLLVVAAGLGLAALTWRYGKVMAPIKEGNAADFWQAACLWRPDPNVTKWGMFAPRIYPPREGWFIYACSHFHGEDVYRVRAEVALADFPAVVEELEAAPKGALRAPVEKAYRAWAREHPDRTDAEALLAALNRAEHEHRREHSEWAYEYGLSRERDFDRRWDEAKRWHWNVFGETAFFLALLLLAAWPWLRNARPWRWALHVGLVPMLLLLPYWLGYAWMTYTSVGPSGGALYPWVITPFRGLYWRWIDAPVLRSLPRPLARCSPGPGPIMSMTFLGGVGPVTILALSAALAAVVYLARRSRAAGEASRHSRP